MNDYTKIAELGWNDFTFMLNAYSKKIDDEVEKMHIQAWLDRAVNATDKKGSPTFTKFEKFYQRKKKETKKSLKIDRSLYIAAQRLEKYRRKEEN